jgi:hypothetical protein
MLICGAGYSVITFENLAEHSLVESFPKWSAKAYLDGKRGWIRVVVMDVVADVLSKHSMYISRMLDHAVESGLLLCARHTAEIM